MLVSLLSCFCDTKTVHLFWKIPSAKSQLLWPPTGRSQPNFKLYCFLFYASTVEWKSNLNNNLLAKIKREGNKGHLYLQDLWWSEWWLILQREAAADSRFQLAVHFVVKWGRLRNRSTSWGPETPVVRLEKGSEWRGEDPCKKVLFNKPLGLKVSLSPVLHLKYHSI